jgi:hypothetical protein
MRLHEFANAEEQLGLLRIIIDNTWSAVAQQAAEKKQADAAKKSKTQARPRPRPNTAGVKRKPPLPSPPKTTKQHTDQDSAQPNKPTDRGRTTKNAVGDNTATAAPQAQPTGYSQALPTTSSTSRTAQAGIAAEPEVGSTDQPPVTAKPHNQGITANNPSFT